MSSKLATLPNTVTELLRSMSIREKLGQCVMIEPCFCLAERTSDMFNEQYSDVLDPKFLAMLIDDYHIGSFLFGGVSRIGDGSPGAWADYIAQVNQYVKNTKLKTPLLFGIDAVHGVNFMKGSTIYNHNLGVTATWNAPLAQEYASTVGEELGTIGFNLNFAPTIDVARDVRWGRVYESLGEDPYLASVMSKSLVSGMQSRGNMGGCGKHFVGYGESRNGMDRTPADLSDRAILEMHAPPFEAAIAADVASIMVSGADVNGVPMPVSKRFMTGMLRDRLGFEGPTMSDWEDVARLDDRHFVCKDRKAAIIRSFNAGLDMNMAVCDIASVDVLQEAVTEGLVDITRVDEAAGRVLNLKYKLGLFHQADVDVANAATKVGSKQSRHIAKQLAAESATLLQNKDNLLPLNKTLKSILVTGAQANSKRHLCGGWTLGWAGAEEQDLNCKTILGAIKDKVSAETQVTWVPDLDTFAKLDLHHQHFDLCISVVSEEPHAEWFGDSFELGLEPEEENMLNAAIHTGLPVALVSVIGRPLNISKFVDHIEALLWAWLPGTEGADAIADILFGDVNPSGKLPISFPKDGSHVPVVYNARTYLSGEISTRYDPLFEFGFGLSYTEFTYHNLVGPERVALDDNIQLSIEVANTGAQAGDDIVQVYLIDRGASVTRPLKSLVAFARVSVAAQETKRVEVTINQHQLGIYDEDMNFVYEPRSVELHVGEQRTIVEIIAS